MSRRRSFLLPCAALCYACFAVIQARPSAATGWILALLLPAALWEVWRRSQIPQRGEDHIDPAARGALRAAAWGACLWIAGRSGPVGHPGFDAIANLGSGVACVAALVALARIAPVGGMLRPPPATRSLDAAAFAALLWGIAVAIPATRALLAPESVRLDPLTIDYATTTAGIGGLLVLTAATWRLRLLRKLEIGVGDRAAGALALASTALLVALPAAALRVAAPDRLLPAALVAASLACIWTVATAEPTTVSSALRGILAVMIMGAPATLAAGVAARQLPQHAGAVALFTSVVAIGVGLVARSVARPLGPEQSRWLDAIEAASRGALQPEPDAAIRAALAALSRMSGAAGTQPELWRLHPEEYLTVDVAGYLHVERGAAPERLYELALDEPERTLRAESLRALEVRRPEVRPLVAWFDARRAFSATLVLDEDGPIGFLLLPRGNRKNPMTLEEARALRLLADRLSALLAVSSALSRSRERELSAIARADALDDERQRLEYILLHESGRNRVHAERAARGVRSSAYGPAARLCLDQLERLGRLTCPITLLAPPGVDATGWAALAHLASPRAAGALVVVDGGSGIEHVLERWEDPHASPLVLADGGTLLVTGIASLPVAIQDLIARHLSRAAGPTQRSSVLPPGLIVTTRVPAATLVEDGRLSPALARWLGDACVELPTLAERPEDLRALVLDELSRLGRPDGQPLGIEDLALRALIEHPWPGNDLELKSLLVRAAALADGPTVTLARLMESGFVPAISLPRRHPTTRRAARRT